MASIYELGLEKNDANFVPLTPMSFLGRAAEVHPERVAIVHGALRQSWRETDERCRRLASALRRRGIGRGDTVAALMPNVPALIEAHFGVPMSGAVLNALNTRLDAESIAFMLMHGEAKALLVDRELAALASSAVNRLGRDILVVDVEAPELDLPPTSELSYEALLAEGDPSFVYAGPEDEWDAICLNYTSGTTGDPKGVVYHHRGACLNAISNILEWDLPKHPVYLWTLPLFHCNGWCFAWTIAARAGTNVCLRKVDAKAVLDLIREHRVTHYCGAPVVHSMIASAADEHAHGITHRVSAMVAGAAPPAAMLEAMENAGFDLTHVYGLTETYGPAAVCEKHEAWDALPLTERARLNARQGVRYHLQEIVSVLDPATMRPVPADGETMGEVMFRGNITMKGYLKNPSATKAAFAGGWFHTGDLGVRSPDGYVKVKDRSKDVIISGGENISSLEVEDALCRHPAVLAAAVVAQPDAKWGETPCAFIELRPNAEVATEALIAFCRERLSGFKVPRTVIFGPLPRTSTGKVQKFELRARVGSSRAIDG
ncbi:MAG: acyl-CoA synthetase [Labilithrix sp.]|nr:acyl-CoA synthetase [Labilithrix sp.]